MIFDPDEVSLVNSLRLYWTNMITKGQPNDNVSLTWPQYSSNNDLTLVLNKNITTSTSIGSYSNCDVMSYAQVKAFGEYLGLKVTCTIGNKLFIINSTAANNSVTIICAALSLICLHFFRTL